jgi:hypothetical protein
MRYSCTAAREYNLTLIIKNAARWIYSKSAANTPSKVATTIGGGPAMALLRASLTV